MGGSRQSQRSSKGRERLVRRGGRRLDKREVEASESSDKDKMTTMCLRASFREEEEYLEGIRRREQGRSADSVYWLMKARRWCRRWC